MNAAVTEAAASRWLRVAKIVAVFVIIGPLIASVGLFIGVLVEGASNPRYAVSLANGPFVWWSWVMMSFMVGAPYVLLTGGIFALLAVFAGARQFWVAIAVALAPLPVLHLLPAVGDPIWRWDPFFWQSAVALAVVPTGVCWYLSRRWLGQPQ